MALTDGIIGCWSPSLGVTGNVLRDVSGKNNHGTLQNMDPTTDWVSTSVRGVHGRVLDFDGTNDWVLMSSNGYSGINLPNVSATAWYYRRGAGFHTILHNQSTMYWYAGSTVRLYMGGAGVGLFVDEIASAIPVNQWTFLGWSYANRVVRFFRNGVFTSTATISSGTPNFGANSAIGSAVASGNGAELANGQLGEINLYQRTLADVEFLELYRQGNGAIGRQLTDYNRRKYFPLYPSKPSKASLINVKPSIPSFENGFAPRDGEADNPNLLRGLVGAWCPSLGVTGNTLRDISGRNNHGTLTNMDPATDWVVNDGQYALDFDGVNDYVVAGSLPDFPSDFTLSGWGYVYSGDTGVDAVLVRTTNVFGGAARSGVSFVMRDAFTSATTERIGCEITDGLNRYHIESIAGYARDTWHHILCRRQAGVFSLWINGEQEPNTQNFSGLITNNTDTYIGAVIDYQGGLSTLRRRVDSVAVYNRALSSNEIRELYQLGRGAIYTLKSQKKIVTSPSRSTPKSRASIIVRPPKPNTDNLLKGIVGCWSPSLGVTGNTLRDVSGRNNHGVLTNMDPATDWVSTSVRGVSGRVLDYDGSNDYIDAKNTMIGRTQPQFACSIWMLLRASYGIAVQCNWVSGFVWYVVPFLGATPYGQQQIFIGSGGSANATIPTTLNVWRHYWFSFDNGQTRAGYDGVQNYSATYGNAPSYVTANQAAPRDNTRITIGGYSAETVNGQIGEFSWWNRPVTAAEMGEVYRQGNGAIGRALTQQTTRSNFSSKTFPSTWLKVGDEWTEVQPKVATGSQTSIITRPPIEPSYKSGYAPRDGEPLYPNLHKGLVGAWCPSLGVTGGVLRDVSGRNNHGTLTNMNPATDWVVSGGEYALNFAGTRRVSTTRALISGTQGFTLSAWVYLTGTTGYRTVCGNYGFGNPTGVQITIWQATGGVPANAPTLYYGSTAINATTEAGANQWNHVAATRSGNAVAIYLNGAQVGSGTNTGSVGTSRNWTLGQDTDGTGEPMIGYIDDHAVYSRPLTPNEIQQLYLLGRGGILTLKQPSPKTTSTIWQPSQPRLYTGDWT